MVGVKSGKEMTVLEDAARDCAASRNEVIINPLFRCGDCGVAGQIAYWPIRQKAGRRQRLLSQKGRLAKSRCL